MYVKMYVCVLIVAKEASDIVILDDNFSSIVKSVMWGRLKILLIFSSVVIFFMYVCVYVCMQVCL
jgi:magnesium-transporting ATPase (P-type)